LALIVYHHLPEDRFPDVGVSSLTGSGSAIIFTASKPVKCGKNKSTTSDFLWSFALTLIPLNLFSMKLSC